MLKIRTRILSAVVAAAVALTAAMSVSADVKPYTLGTKVAGTLSGSEYYFEYTFNVSQAQNVILNAKNPSNKDLVLGVLPYIDSPSVSEIKPAKIDGGRTQLQGDTDYRVSFNYGSTELNATYALQPGDYILNAATREAESGVPYEFTLSSAGASAPATTAPVGAALQSFRPGIVASSLSAALTPTKDISVGWGKIDNARYAIYYTALDKATGVFSNWTVKGVDTNAYTIPNAASGKIYYITILPFIDMPSRQYGGFSAYTQVVT